MKTNKTNQKRHLQNLSAVCLSVFLFVTAAFAQPPKLPENGKIAFAGIDKGHYDIFTINSDGTELVNITNSPEHDEISPSWSPDGEKLAFLYKLYTNAYVLGYMDKDGSNTTFLIEVLLSGSSGDTISWSPDGKKIAFTSHGEIYTIDNDGSNIVNITNDPAIDRQPSWSPDGETIAFSRQESSDYRVYTVNADGKKLERTLLGVGFSGATAAKYSPDSTRFLYFDDLWGDCSCLISAKTDGTNNIILAYNSSSADWSPDGLKVVFAGWDGSSSQIYVMPANGDGRQDQIGPKNARQPDWQPLP
ncbi:MAG: hypothetical protein ACKVRN_01150 [Pyrinomonadaceae bacterium]